MSQAYDKPLPVTDALTLPFWDAARDGRLVFQRCADCGYAQFYPRPHCTRCHGVSVAWETASGRATLYSFSVVRRSAVPGFADDLPYVFALVDLEEGPRLTTNVIGVPIERLRCGMGLRVTFRAATAEITLPLFTHDPELAGSVPAGRTDD